MSEVTASRTLVKSAPELWTECSDARSLARHLGAFGEIRITRLEPETAVAWEGERASGTVRLEPSGWGTRVVLTATPAPLPDRVRLLPGESAHGDEATPAEEAPAASGQRGATVGDTGPVLRRYGALQEVSRRRAACSRGCERGGSVGVAGLPLKRG